MSLESNASPAGPMASAINSGMASSGASSSAVPANGNGNGSGNGAPLELAPSPQPPRRPVKLKPLRKILHGALGQFKRRDLYLFFAQPVKASDVPDYHDHIKQPMDLGTMQAKLDRDQYKTLNDFRNDFLLVTRNAQYYNTLEGPSAIVHTEAKKLEEWGLRYLAREEPAVEETAPKPELQASAAPSSSTAAPQSPHSATAAADKSAVAKRIRGIKLKKPAMSGQSSASATPRPATPSRLQHEVKAEDRASPFKVSVPKRSHLQAEDEEQSDGMQQQQSVSAKATMGQMQSDEESDEDQEDDSEGNDSEDDEEGSDDSDDDEEDSEEEDDDGEDDDDDDDDDDADSSRRGNSIALDSLSNANARGSLKLLKPRRRHRLRGSAAKKKHHRQSIIASLLMRPGEDKDKKQEIAKISSTSDVIAAEIPRHYSAEGAIDLRRLLEDEKRALLRSAGEEGSSHLLVPFVDALTPLHPDLLPNASSHLRHLRDAVDGFGSALAEEPKEADVTHTYDIPVGKPPDQRKYPFGISSGWMFQQKAANVPLAWPRLISTPSANAGEQQPQHGGGPLRRKDRDMQREREELGLANVDDWTFPRAHQSRLVEARDLGVYPGLLPAAWVNHIAYQKGGPAQSRLPPHYLAVGSAFENAILDELASLPNRVFLSAKPGIMSTTTALPAPSPLDVATAIELASDRDWDLNGEEAKKAGVRGADVLREAIYGGALGEAYAASVDDFVRGASASAQRNFEEEEAILAELKHNDAKQSLIAPETVSNEQEQQGPQSYFDENGEMYNVDAYIGVDFVPLEVRKEAGMVAQTGIGSGLATERQTPVPAQTPPLDDSFSHKRVRTTSRYIPNKRRATENLEMSLRSEATSTAADTPMDTATPIDSAAETPSTKEIEQTKEDEEERSKEVAFKFKENDEVSAFLRGSILDRSLFDHVKFTLIDPLSGGLLQLLDLVAEGIWKDKNDQKSEVEFTPEPEILKEVEGLVSSTSVKSEDGQTLRLDLEEAPGLPLAPPPDFKSRFVELVGRLHSREYYKIKSQLLELSRAQNSAIQLDGLVRGKEDLTRQEVEKSDPSHASALLFDNISAPFDSQRAHTILSEAAVEVVALSDALKAGKGEPTAPMTDQDRLDKLRNAYITLVHHVAQRDLRKGHWSARLEAMRKDDMRASQSGGARTQSSQPPSRPSFGNAFPISSPSTPGSGPPLDKISSVNSARLDISKLGAHPSLLATLNAMSSKKESPQPQSQSQSQSQSPAPNASPSEQATSSLPATHPLLPGGQVKNEQVE